MQVGMPLTKPADAFGKTAVVSNVPWHLCVASLGLLRTSKAYGRDLAAAFGKCDRRYCQMPLRRVSPE